MRSLDTWPPAARGQQFRTAPAAAPVGGGDADLVGLGEEAQGDLPAADADDGDVGHGARHRAGQAHRRCRADEVDNDVRARPPVSSRTASAAVSFDSTA